MLNAAQAFIKQLEELGIDTAFCVTGGAASHLMEALRTSTINTIHMHHEQACAMAADAYSRVAKKPALVLVTNGPGVSNTVTGVLGAYQDSCPMIVVSGQVPIKQTVRSEKNIKLRQLGVQEAPTELLIKGIVKSFKFMKTPDDAVQAAIDAYKISMSDRKGPTWVEFSLDVQSSICNSFPKSKNSLTKKSKQLDFESVEFREAFQLLREALRPLVVIGSGIHLSNTELELRAFINEWKIPVVSTWSASDIFASDEKLYIGNFGILGQRAANYAVQTADFILVLGSRLSIPNIGYATELFASNSKVAMVDIDPNELYKTTIKIDCKICCNLEDFFVSVKRIFPLPQERALDWASKLESLKETLKLTNEPYLKDKESVDAYELVSKLSAEIENNTIVVTDMGTSFTCTMQAFENNGFNRLLTPSGTSSMGFGLPGAIGAYFAKPDSTIICIAGDGGFQMNIQELQTVMQYKIPIKIIVLNSNGYLAISIMQKNLFSSNYFGSTELTGVSAPNFSNIASAYGINSVRVTSSEQVKSELSRVLSSDTAQLVEIMISKHQLMRPRNQSMKDEKGKFYSSSLDLMWPYLSEEKHLKIRNHLLEP